MLRTYKSDRDWLQARKTTIGASESAALVGANPWKSALTVYASKVEGHEEDVTKAMLAGQHFEHAIAEFWNETREGQSFELITPQMLANVNGARVVWTSELCPLVTCTPDFFAVNGDEIKVVEVKNVNPDSRQRWQDGPPLYYQLQVMHQIGVMRENGYEINEGVLVVYFGGADVREYPITFDGDLWAMLRNKCEEFWVKHVAERNPPDADEFTNVDEVNRVWKRAQPGSTTEVPAHLVIAYRDAKAQAKIAEEAAEQARAKLCSVIGSNEGATVDGALVITWKNQTQNMPAREARTVEMRVLRTTKAAEGLSL